MSNIINRNNIVGGLDYDSLSQDVAPNDYRYALNIRNGVAYVKKKGGATNVKGNVLVPLVYYPYGALTGKSKTIGSYEDREFNTIIYFVWNSDGKHSIFRYFPDKISPNNPYGEIHQIALADFGWKPNTQITSINTISGKSGVLLYWCDNIQGRRLNITKSDLVGKFKTWNCYLPKSFTNFQSRFFFNINAFGTTNSIATLTINTTGQPQITSIPLLWEYIATQINADPAMRQYVTATANDQVLDIAEVQANQVNAFFIAADILTVPANWYGNTITERFIDEAIWPSWLSPLVTFGVNTKKAFNNVKNQVWQFRTSYLTNDFEKSLLSPFTQIPVNEYINGGLQVQSYNFLHIDFNDSQLVEYLTQIKYINISARSGNAGVEQQAAQLQIQDFIDYNYLSNQWICTYDFYNDTVANVLDPIFVQQQESGVPINNAAQDIVQNRLVKLNNTKGLNPISDFNANISQTFLADNNEYVYISVDVLIYNCMMDNNQSSSVTPSNAIQPIVKWAPGDPTNPTIGEKYPQYGGFAPDPSPSGVTTTPKDSTYGQEIPLGGFLLFSAGTDSWAITQQVQQTANGTGTYLPTILGTVLDVNLTNGDNVRKFINASSSDPFKIYQTATLKVQKGINTIRIASHWCSYGNELQKGAMYNIYNGREYQKTSTNVYATNKYDSASGAFLGYDYNIKEITIDLTNAVTGSTTYLGRFVVEDCKPIATDSIPLGRHTKAVSGYLINPRNGTSSANYAAAPFMEYQVVNFSNNHAAQPNAYFLTDHNGYFYFSLGVNQNGHPSSTNRSLYWYGEPIAGYTTGNTLISAIRFCNSTLNEWKDITSTVYESDSILQDMQNNTLHTVIYNQGGSQSGPTIGPVLPHVDNQYDGKSVQLLLIVEDNMFIDTISTELNCNFTDINGNPISNSLFYSTLCGRYSESDNSGNANILIYATATQPFASPPVSRSDSVLDDIPLTLNPTPQRSGNIVSIYNSAANNISNNNQSYILNFPPSSISNQYIANPFVLDLQAIPFGKALKRGGTYQLSVRYKDAAGRLTNMNTNHSSIFYIPYITEDLHKYFPSQYAIGTYLYGKPTISVELNFNPPVEAVSYDICLTQNQYETSYLQWAVNEVFYVTNIGYSAAEVNVAATTLTKNSISGGAIVSSTAITSPADVYNPPVRASYLSGTATNIYISLKNLSDFQNANPQSILSYVWQPGDRIRLIADNLGRFYTELYELEVQGYDTSLNCIIVSNQYSTPEIYTGTFLELVHVRQKTELDEQIFYEVGESFLCTNPNTTNNAHSVNPIVLTCGDTYWRNRQFLINDSTNFIFESFSMLVEDPNLSDFFKSASWDIGRPGINDPYNVQLNNPTELIVSDTYQIDSNSNGFCNFQALNSKILDKQYGAGQRLVMLGDILHVICTKKSISDYIGQRVLTESKSLNGPVAIANEFLGTNRAQVKDLGTQHPASVSWKDNYIYGFDMERSTVWRDANDGMTEISKVKMQSYFKELVNNGLFSVTSGIDKYYNEYLLTTTKMVIKQTQVHGANQAVIQISLSATERTQIEATAMGYIELRFFNNITKAWVQEFFEYTINPQNILEVPYTGGGVNIADPIFMFYGGDEDTISWQEDKNRFGTHYSFTPECYGVLGNLLYSYSDGGLWVHDQNPLFNNFYSKQSHSVVTPVFNTNPDIIKIWLSLGMEMLQTNGQFDWSAAIKNDYGQKSTLVPQNFRLKERQWFVDLKRDITDTSVHVPLVNGKRLRSEALEVELTNSYADEFFLRALMLLSIISERSGH